MKSYCDEIDRYFAPFFDAVMSMAVHVKDVATLAERVPFDAPDSKLDKRRRPADARRFLAALRRFEERSRFQIFLDSHAAFYQATGTRLRTLVESEADLSWFDRFFGARPGARFVAVPSVVSGGGNSGLVLLSEDGREETYAMIGVWRVDGEGQPFFGRQMLPTLVHEFAHSYVNPLAERLPAVDESRNAIYKSVANEMRAQDYGTGHTLVCESLVRASTARYVLAHDGASAARLAIHDEEERSFVWTGELFQLLRGYEADRASYATLEPFMPKVAAYFESLAPGTAGLVAEYDARRPHIVSMVPANGSQDVDPAATRLVITFRPPDASRLSLCNAANSNNKEPDPELSGPAYDQARTTLSAEVRPEPNHNYEFRLNCRPGFMADDGLTLKPVTVKFAHPVTALKLSQSVSE